MTGTRIGIGYDIHPFVPDRRLVLGGVEIPFGQGLDGWSDADVLTHAIIDSMLGAAAMGDIGKYFPPGKQEYRDISSLEMLKQVNSKVTGKGWSVVNIDSTVIAEQPVLKDHIDSMREKLGHTLGIDIEKVSVKASTANGLGEIGKVEAIAAMAVTMIEGED
ncbi:MAG: 2-C-methyl-D-erythritol 2,4-cyclodiphosphate synthase [Dehalococcoidales bacterium]|nr:MAG: 2-C-methyl-D-erythritol 2,4-cyclodiphosphate synthase [Dehalococcoidales bacterium]